MILLVEDNPDHEALTLRTLRKASLEADIEVVRDGEEALSLLLGETDRQTSGFIQPTLIFLDLKLPKIPGMDVLKKLRADPRTQYIPVVVLTTSDEEKDIVSSYNLDANAYLCKPLNLGDLARVLHQLGISEGAKL